MVIVLDAVVVSLAENDGVIIVLDVVSEIADCVLIVVVFENMGVSGTVLVSRVVTGAIGDVIVVVDDVPELEVITTMVVVGNDTEAVVSEVVVDSVVLVCDVVTSGVLGISVVLLVTNVSSGVVTGSVVLL